MKRVAAVLGAVVFAAFTAACSQTDAGITTKIKAQFATDDLVKAHEINIDTQHHVVTLNGDVQSAAAKEQAVRIARATKGVTDVVDNLRVNPAEATTGVESSMKEGAADVRQGADNLGTEIKEDAAKTGNAIERGAEATGRAVKKGAEATADGAKKAGRKVRDAVTDDNRDSDHDGH